MKKISIIIATYNASSTLKRCLDSIVEQLTEECELILIDGKSRDSTNQIIESYGATIDVHISEPDSGIYDAWNKGVTLCNGQWVMFLGADDQLERSALSKYLICIDKLPYSTYDLVSSKRKMFDEQGKEIRTVGKKWDWPSCLSGMPISHPGALHNHRLFDMHGLFTCDYKIAGDYELLMRNGKYLKTYFIDEVTVLVQEGGISDSIDAIFEYYSILRKCALKSELVCFYLGGVVCAKYFIKKLFRLFSLNVHM